MSTTNAEMLAGIVAAKNGSNDKHTGGKAVPNGGALALGHPLGSSGDSARDHGWHCELMGRSCGARINEDRAAIGISLMMLALFLVMLCAGCTGGVVANPTVSEYGLIGDQPTYQVVGVTKTCDVRGRRAPSTDVLPLRRTSHENKLIARGQVRLQNIEATTEG